MKIEADNSGGGQTQISQLWGIPKLQWGNQKQVQARQKAKKDMI